MKIYSKPEVKITILNSEDVLMVSGGLNVVSTKFTVTKNGKTYTPINF